MGEYRGLDTVRNQAKAQEVRETLNSVYVNTRNLTFVELDLTADQGWNLAAKGCDFIMHVASPFFASNPKNPQEMIAPAVDGTLRVMRAAKKAGAKRVVLTSSIMAMMGSLKTGKFTSKNWTEVNAVNISTYTKSKTLAENAAWEFIDNQGGEKPIELVVIAPGGVLGPPLGHRITSDPCQ